MKPILQVEDDPNDVFFLQHAMQKAGVTNPIQVAIDGQQAIDYLKGAGKFADRELFPLPCLVLLDLKLPHVMGLEVLRWIRSQPLEHLVVIILSASGEAVDIATAYRLGANAFLVKPSEANKLESLVMAIRDFWLVHNVLPQDVPMGKNGELRLPARLISRRNINSPPIDDGPGVPQHRNNGRSVPSRSEADNELKNEKNHSFTRR
jgi:CheY-like chemotaxis protein